MNLRILGGVSILLAGTASSQLPVATAAAPQVDHHQHLLSPALAKAWSVSEPVTADRLDWTSQQVARYPDRLRAFCSINPLIEYALAEIDRCAKHPNLRYGLKIHFANSQVNLRNARHVAQLQQVFRAANTHRMAIVVHVWTGDHVVGNPLGRAEAEIFLNEILSTAPDIPIQIAHLGGSGPRLDSGTKEAMIRLAEAVSAGDPRTRNLYFDITTNVTNRSSAENAEFVTAFDRLDSNASCMAPIWPSEETRRLRRAGERTGRSLP